MNIEKITDKIMELRKFVIEGVASDLRHYIYLKNYKDKEIDVYKEERIDQHNRTFSSMRNEIIEMCEKELGYEMWNNVLWVLMFPVLYTQRHGNQQDLDIVIKNINKYLQSKSFRKKKKCIMDDSDFKYSIIGGHAKRYLELYNDEHGRREYITSELKRLCGLNEKN